MNPKGWKRREGDGVELIAASGAEGDAEVSAKEDGAADGDERLSGGGGDGFFNEALLDAGAHVTEDDFDQVFCFEGGGGGEEMEEDAEAGSAFGGGGEGMEGFGDGVKGERRREGGVKSGVGARGFRLRGGGGEEVAGSGAEIAVEAVGGSEGGVGEAGELEEGIGEEAGSHAEGAGVGFREGAADGVGCGQGGGIVI